jgi:hypothetical protein
MSQTFYHPDSVSGMHADRADDWKSSEPFYAIVRLSKDDSIHVSTDMDGCVCVYLHRPGAFLGKELTAAQAGELETALYRAREHVGSGA